MSSAGYQPKQKRGCAPMGTEVPWIQRYRAQGEAEDSASIMSTIESEAAAYLARRPRPEPRCRDTRNEPDNPGMDRVFPLGGSQESD
jgi:hypothetical protein